MKKTILMIFLLITLFTLTSCVIRVVPPGAYSYEPSPVIYTSPYTVYTPPIDYYPPQGVFYPWGNMGGGNDRHHRDRDDGNRDRGGRRGR